MQFFNKTSIKSGAAAQVTCGDAYELVMLTLTLPLWTFITFYLLLLLIHYLRRLQYFSLYDRCTPRNAHFRYDFHIITGKYSANFNRLDSQIILDLLDNQLISTITVQIPGQTLFNDSQIFVYKHSRSNLRCVNFTIYRRHPIKDVRCIRVAHSCGNPDSRIYIYGLNLYDSTNGENKFFPISSVVKYRGTQWALLTTFEPKNETNFQELGVNCYDPFGYSIWPTYLEMVTILFYIWCSAFCFGHLISVNEIWASVPLHTLTILFITGSSATVIGFIYIRGVKSRIVDLHYDSLWWLIIQDLTILFVIIVSVAFWFLATNQSRRCLSDTYDWMISTISCSSILTLLFIVTNLILTYRKQTNDQTLVAETDKNLAKTNSKQNIEFSADPALSWWCKRIFTQPQTVNLVGSKTSKNAAMKSISKGGTVKGTETRKKRRSDDNKPQQRSDPKENEETLANAFGMESKYMKTKNRNSISQYV